MNQRILVAEDELEIAQLLRLHLSELGADVQLAHDGNSALSLARQGGWNLLVLDRRLPGLDGLSLCQRLRRDGDRTPILMLTALSSEMDRVLGLECGADDYVSKPFSVLELMARVKAQFRRQQESAAVPIDRELRLSNGPLRIDLAQHQVQLGDRVIELTAREFDLLVHFARHPGRVFSRAQLLDSVWGYSHDGYDHTVNSHINRLRAKIETDPANPALIVTVWGVGYRMERQG